jgi:peroxin-2
VYAHAALTVVLPYFHKRVRAFALSRAWPDAPVTHHRRRLWEAMSLVETVHAYASLIGFCLFLRSGRFVSQTLVDYLFTDEHRADTVHWRTEPSDCAWYQHSS